MDAYLLRCVVAAAFAGGVFIGAVLIGFGRARRPPLVKDDYSDWCEF